MHIRSFGISVLIQHVAFMQICNSIFAMMLCKMCSIYFGSIFQIGWVIWNFKGSCCHFHSSWFFAFKRLGDIFVLSTSMCAHMMMFIRFEVQSRRNETTHWFRSLNLDSVGTVGSDSLFDYVFGLFRVIFISASFPGPHRLSANVYWACWVYSYGNTRVLMF